MTPELLPPWTDWNCSSRLRGGGHDLGALAGETLGESNCETADRYGPHELIAVTVNRAELGPSRQDAARVLGNACID